MVRRLFLYVSAFLRHPRSLIRDSYPTVRSQLHGQCAVRQGTSVQRAVNFRWGAAFGQHVPAGR